MKVGKDFDVVVIGGGVGAVAAVRELAATLAIVAKVPVTLLRHAVAPHPTVNQVWDLLLGQESEPAPLLKNGEVVSL